MTALIGGICVGIVWGVWVTRKLLSFNQSIPQKVKRKRELSANLAMIINQQTNGKKTERQTKEAEGESLDSN